MSGVNGKNGDCAVFHVEMASKAVNVSVKAVLTVLENSLKISSVLDHHVLHGLLGLNGQLALLSVALDKRPVVVNVNLPQVSPLKTVLETRLKQFFATNVNALLGESHSFLIIILKLLQLLGQNGVNGAPVIEIAVEESVFEAVSVKLLVLNMVTMLNALVLIAKPSELS